MTFHPTMRALFVLYLFAALPAGAQCFGDFDGDNRVAIEEVQVSIVNALNGCAEPPASCPLTFETDNTQNGAGCLYLGVWNSICPSPTLGTVFESNGTRLRVLLFRPDFIIEADVVSATEATITTWAPTLTPGEADRLPLSGSITLGADGRSLVIAPDSMPFTVSGCPFALYEGQLARVVEPAVSVARHSAWAKSFKPIP